MSRLVVSGVSKTFGHTRVLDAITLDVANGSATAVVGASGCGKTTLLRVIAGFESPDAGSVSVGSETVVREGFSIPPNRRNIGYVAQDGALFPHLTVGQNIAYGLNGGLSGRRRRHRDRVVELLDMVSLGSAYADRRPHELSGGQQQRVALARALARKPDVMLLDEPFSALDTGLRATTRQAVADTLRAAGMTSILVTHDQEEALSFADQVAVMCAGRFTQVGSPEQVYAAPADLFTARFLGDCVLLDGTVESGVAECALGRVPVRSDAPTGAVTVMTRPEQLVAQVVTDDEPGTGTVRAVEFRGADVMLTIALDGVAAPIQVRRISVGAPVVGERVRLEVLGTAVAFAAESDAAVASAPATAA
ncbi:ABC transporter ATP-binding protein [Nocardia otitidiscaviarum]|uniref:ABC-type quaternary amine transporter n=1 Tax=Nocardia otitidiscaviarum TaxID=1823 RepID=A0A516NRI9_9NOCA|nr:ABC transporter ATP-binding protein [Nocardia otitidiscaviarum]MCP9620708.1 ABC transporter ATP-binding protein [Nocardia otitidiscaviarum]QDP81519.1 ABC transporter ATP-binding protein [Nocardia otitidiscaviarum]